MIGTILFPQWLQKVTLGMPTRWAMDGLEAMTWRGLSFSSAIAPIAVLVAFAALFGIIAVTRFRWEAESWIGPSILETAKEKPFR